MLQAPPSDKGMSSERQRAAIVRFIRYDYFSLLCLLGPLVAWGMFAATACGFSFDRSTGTNQGGAFSESHFYLGAAVLSSAVLLPLLARRVWSLSSVFRDGERVTGRIVNVWFVSGRGRVDYTYTFNGREYTAGNATTKNDRTKLLQKGQAVSLLVDREKPERAIMEDLYR
jgi:hypothetical protein